MASITLLQSRDPGTYQLYEYQPSLPAAIVAILVFAILSILHGFHLIKARTWFCIPFLIGGLFETIGYIGRALNHSNSQVLAPYVLQSILILVAPALFAATLYMTLARLIRATQSELCSPIRSTWLTKVFVLADVFTFFVQAAGAGIEASNFDVASAVKMGQDIILAGLALQIGIFGFFVAVSVTLHVRLRARPTLKSMDPEVKWVRMLSTLYVCCGLIMVRNIVRIAEYAGGRQGYLLSNEWTIYVFDAVLMAITMLIYLVGFPTLVRPAAYSPDLESKQIGPGVTSERAFELHGHY